MNDTQHLAPWDGPMELPERAPAPVAAPWVYEQPKPKRKTDKFAKWFPERAAALAKENKR